MSLDSNLQSAFNAVGIAIKGKIPSTEKGVANGVATLDGTGKVPSSQLPSYVDDVVEYASTTVFPATGVSGVLYIDISSNKQYRWSGSQYVKITSGAVDSVNNQTGIVNLTKTDIGLDLVDNTSDITKPVSTATQTALNLKANLSSPTFTGTVSGISKSMVGLANVDNTSDALKPVSTATQTALNLKADTTALSTLSTNIGSTTTDFVAVFNAALV